MNLQWQNKFWCSCVSWPSHWRKYLAGVATGAAGRISSQLYRVGRYEEAMAALQKAGELNPQLSSLHLTRRIVLFSEGRQQEALAEMEKETGEWEKLSGEALAYYALGRRAESDNALNKLMATHQNDAAFQIAEVLRISRRDRSSVRLARSCLSPARLRHARDENQPADEKPASGSPSRRIAAKNEAARLE